MNNFEILQKTKIIFGKNTESTVGKEIKKYSNNCLLVHDGGKYLESLLKKVYASLSEEGIEYYEISGVRVNPLYSKCLEGINLCKEHNIGFVLSIGGGSVMDTGKFIAVEAKNPVECGTFAYNPTVNVTQDVIPHGVISTLSGTGSEFSACTMMVDDRKVPNEKMCLINPCFFNDFAIINPELNYSLPNKQTACGAVDMISHSLENYITNDLTGELCDYYFEGVIKTALKYAPIACKENDNYQARANLCIASNMAMIPNMSYACVNSDWVVHAFENPITCKYQKTHGEILGILTLSYFRFCYDHDLYIEKLVKWANRCMNAEIDYYHYKDTILKGIDNLRTWLKDLNMPTTLSEIGINVEDLDDCAEQCVPAGTISKLTKQQVMEIYKLAK